MRPSNNVPLSKTIVELAEVRKQLVGKRLPYDSRRRLIMVGPGISGLWPECQRLTFQAFSQIRSKRDWLKVQNLCIRTPETKFLYDLFKRHYAPKKKA